MKGGEFLGYTEDNDLIFNMTKEHKQKIKERMELLGYFEGIHYTITEHKDEEKINKERQQKNKNKYIGIRT